MTLVADVIVNFAVVELIVGTGAPGIVEKAVVNIVTRVVAVYEPGVRGK